MKKSGDSIKIMRFYFPGDAWKLDINLIPRAYFHFKLADRCREK